MSDNRTDLPSIKSANFQQRTREVLMTYMGRQGDPLDRGLTLRDLLENGIVSFPDGYKPRPGGGSIPLIPGGAIDDEVDLTPPPTPTGFAVDAAISNIFIEHDAPTYTQGHGHMRTRVYGATWVSGALPVFADAIEITQFSGQVFAYPTNPNTTWHLWIKWETKDGVLSVDPAGGTNGLVVTTGQDVAQLLAALEGELSESQLAQALRSRIDLIDGPASQTNTVNWRLAQEAAARGAAIAQESSNRAAAIAAEVQNRTAEIATATDATNAKIQIESHQRMDQVQQAGEAALRAVVIANTERIDRQTDTAAARQELRADLQAGLSAEASARLALTAVVNQNAADILSEQTARANADSALVSDVSALTTMVNNNTAAISNEATARATADSAEAAERNLLAAQMRGGYTGNDLGSVTTGLLYQERMARITQDEALSQQITLLSAGAGEQFDGKTIWYFDSGLEQWSGNGTPTVSQGWLRPANQATGAYVESPAGIAADGNRYGQVRLRVRKTGAPTFAGYLWWRTPTDSTWDTARRVALTEPTFDANGIGLITVSPAWAATVDKIRLDLSDAQTATNAFEIDWVAIGRPSPGASSAQLLEEQQARATADAAEVTARETLSSKLTGLPDPTGATLSGLTSGLIFDERVARTSADGALSTSITSLQATVTNNYNELSSAITTEQTARASGDSAQATAREALSTKVLGTSNPNSVTLETLASGLLYEEKQSRVAADNSLSTSISGLNSTVGTLSADVVNLQQTTASLTTASAQSSESLVVADRRLRAALDQQAETTLRDVLGLDVETRDRVATLGVVRNELTVRIDEGLLAEAEARTLLAAVVNANTAAIQTEVTTRATQTEALSTSLSALTATTNSNTAAIVAEQAARTNAEASTASQINTLTATVGVKNRIYRQPAAPTNALVGGDLWFDSDDGNKPYRWDGAAWIGTEDTRIAANTAAIQTEATARADADQALAQQITTLSAEYRAADTDLSSAIQTEATARANAIAAEATARQTLQSVVNANTAAIQTEATTRANETGSLFAKYTVKVDVNGYVSGFGLASTANDGTPTSEFTVVADKFSIAPVQTDNAANDGSPFFHRTTPTTINGVAVPAGTYMKAAYIHDATITNAKIANLAVDDAKIANLSVSKLDAGSLKVGSYISSANYVAGSQGFGIWATGAAEFNNVTVRGTVYANAGVFSGTVYASSGSFTGTVNATSGTFSGAVYASSGSFTGNIYSNTGTIGGVTINENGLNGGSFIGYAWPTDGGGGFHLGPYGLLLGNANLGRYLQIEANGNIHTPGFNVVNGTMTVHQANVINTLNIAGNAVTSAVASVGGTVSFGELSAYTPVDLCTLGFSSTGAPTLLFAGVHSLMGFADVASMSVIVRTVVDGGDVRSNTQVLVNSENSGDGLWLSSFGGSLAIPPILITGLSAGWHTIQLQLYATSALGSYNNTASGGVLAILETKR